MTPINSWGRLNPSSHVLYPLSNRQLLESQLGQSTLPGIAHGMGRSYGDSCLNPGGSLWLTSGLDHFRSFDSQSGRLVCEAGVQLKAIQQLLIPQGWMLPVTPGTRFVTIGGAIANDVHGKNHHVQGSFGDHVTYIKLVRTDGEVIECSPNENPEWFAATVGGLGLTGIIAEAEIQLRKVEGPWLETETIPYFSLEEFFTLADESENDWEYTVSWVDCVSRKGTRGIFMRANHTSASPSGDGQKRSLSIPFVPPVSLVNRLTLQPFNHSYFYLQQRQSGRAISHYGPFFYPLDNIRNWNRMYGPRGFYQYQSVIPRHCGKAATQAMLDEIARSGEGSFLTVLKTFAKREAPGLMSFPMEGVTLALDFPNNGHRTLNLFERLDGIVSEAGGRIYPAKDARMSKSLFAAGYPRLQEFLQYRDPGISSGFSRRVIGS
ncbi:MAG: FAD-binding oxidoreductase [Halomonadaceae bacterium]|nr:MAG: FAD-binding oxidoreductase [Halomonadaceae bacterium]